MAELHKLLCFIFQRFPIYGLVLNSSKCRVFATDGIFLGFKNFKQGIAADPERVATSRNRPIVSITIKIRGFIGNANYLRHLIREFLKLAGPLTHQSVELKKISR